MILNTVRNNIHRVTATSKQRSLLQMLRAASMHSAMNAAVSAVIMPIGTAQCVIFSVFVCLMWRDIANDTRKHESHAWRAETIRVVVSSQRE